MRNLFLIAFLVITFLTGCLKKDSIFQPEFRPLSSYTMVNATTNISSAKTYVAGHVIPWKTLPATDNVAQYRVLNFSAFAGENIIRAVNNADTTIAIFSSSKGETFEEGKLNTIFLCGNATAGYDGVFLDNEVPVNYNDSVIGIRFINLSPNSTPLNITLSTSTTVNEVTGLTYKQKNEYKTYSALSSTGARIFQVRDAGGVLLASYTLPVTPASPYTTVGLNHSRFKNITLVIKGLQGTLSGKDALGMIPVPHY